jgi:hypothetical protein
MTKQDLEKLSAPFPPDEIDWKVQRCGMKGSDPWAIVVPFVDARAIMKRLDEVAGAESWQTKLVPTANGMLCELALRVDGEWVSKMDGSDETDYEPFKGGISKALVRAAVHWGIGRELYNLPNVFARFVDRGTAGARWAKIDGREFWWVPDTGDRQEKPAPAAASAQKPAPRPQASDIQHPGEVIVPFGHNQGRRLSTLSEQELAGLADFYARVPDPKGKARTFQQQFERFMASRKKAAS